MNFRFNGYKFTLTSSGVYLSEIAPLNFANENLIEAITEARKAWVKKYGGDLLQLYFMSSDEANVVKIGVSKHPDKRVGQVGAGNLINAIRFSSARMARRYESALHRFFSKQLYAYGYEREWFTLTDEQLHQVTNAHSEYDLCKMMGIDEVYLMFGKLSSFHPGQYIEGVHPRALTKRDIVELGGGYSFPLEATNGHKEDA